MTVTTDQPVETRLAELSDRIDFLVAEAEERRRLRESIAELTGDLSPVARQGMDSVTRVLADAEQRGYVDFTKGGLEVLDKVVSSFTKEDVEALGDNIVLILETVKEMTQPEVMQMMQSTFHGIQDVEEPEQTPSLMRLIGRMRKPETRRGLYRLVVFLESLGNVEVSEKQERKEAQ
ncbi:MAG: DUF1641 domain-containing protein [Acidimicrobiia bacterium]|jgi:uncharacterized protein YjgD (DUF1641 family)